MKIFRLQEGIIILDREEIALIKEFNNVLKKVTKCDDDPTGKLKIRAFQEFNYIYSICDYNSYPNKNGLNKDEAHKWAVSNSGLPKTWKPDNVVLEAMQTYIKLVESPSRELAKELLMSIRNTYKIVSRIREMIETKLEQTSLEATEIDSLISYQNKLMTIADKVPNTINSLKDVMTLIDKDEDITKDVARGGGEIEDSMNPETSIVYD